MKENKKQYVIDWDSVNTIEDVKEILKHSRLNIPDSNVDRLKKYLKKKKIK